MAELATQLRSITARCFSAVELLRRLDIHAVYAFDRLREQLMHDLENAEARAAQAFGRKVADDIKYALVALADETAQRQPGPLRDFWKPRSLQMHYFGDNRAGFGFFDRLDEIRADPGRAASLPVYALCLQFGLRGKYEHEDHGGERELRPRRGAVFTDASTLLNAGSPPLFVHVPRTSEARRPIAAPGSLRWLGLLVLLFAFGFFSLARFGLSDMTAALVDRLTALAEPAPASSV